MTSKWDEFIEQERRKPYYTQLSQLVKTARENGKNATRSYKVFPPSHQVLRCFAETAFEDVKVVILGQDPYHTAGVADGLAFSSAGVSFPPTLKIIFKEIFKEYPGIKQEVYSLKSWAHQGVLLLNTILTVEEGKAKSHESFRWQMFTENAVSELIQHSPHKLVFMFWGKDAKAYKKLFGFGPSQRHLVLEAAHPAAELYNEGAGFIGCDHFKKANEFLIKQGLPEINWAT